MGFLPRPLEGRLRPSVGVPLMRGGKPPAEGGRVGLLAADGGRPSLRRSAIVAERLSGGIGPVCERVGIGGTGGGASLMKRDGSERMARLGDAVDARGGGMTGDGASSGP